MKFIKNFQWISFSVMEFPQTNRTFCKVRFVILFKPNKPIHLILGAMHPEQSQASKQISRVNDFGGLDVQGIPDRL